jgi:hypothetical protein
MLAEAVGLLSQNIAVIGLALLAALMALARMV